MENKTKTRVALALISAPFFILIACLMFTQFALIVKPIFVGSFAFFGDFTIPNSMLLLVVLLIFGAFVLPSILFELNLGDSTEEPNDSPEQLSDSPKTLPALISKIGEHSLHLGAALAITGTIFATLPTLFFTDSQPIWKPPTEEWLIEEYYGFIRGQLFLIGIILLIISLILVIFHTRRKLQLTTNPDTTQTGSKVR